MILGHEGHEVDGREGSAGWNLVVPSPLSRCLLCKQVSSTAAPAAIRTSFMSVCL